MHQSLDELVYLEPAEIQRHQSEAALFDLARHFSTWLPREVVERVEQSADREFRQRHRHVRSSIYASGVSVAGWEVALVAMVAYLHRRPMSRAAASS